MHNSDIWTSHRSNRRKAEAAEMRFLRRLAGYRLIDREQNTNIRAQLNICHRGNKTEQRKRDYYEHILKTKDRGLPIRGVLLQYKPTGQ